jgi:hypothetical protein
MTASQCILGNDHYLLETARMSFEEILPRNKMSNVANNQALVPDNFLYHYTSLTGLQGIVNSGVIWATNIFYLNDSKELLNAVDVARWSFEHLSEHYSLSKEELEFLSQIGGCVAPERLVHPF